MEHAGHGMGDYKGVKGNFWGDEYVCYLDCGNGLMDMQKLSMMPQ